MGRNVRWGSALALAAATLLAGCGAVGPGSGTPGSPTPTLTPVAVPEERGPDGGRLVAPGLSTNGVFDPEALSSAHRATLTARGFVLVRTRSVSRPNDTAGSGPLNAEEYRTAVAPGADSYRLRWAERSSREWPVAERHSEVGIWYSDPVVRHRFVTDDRVARYWGTDDASSGGPVRDPSRTESVRADLAAVDLRVVGNGTVDGTRIYRLRGSRIDAPGEFAVPPLLSDPRNVSMVARIDERGVVRSYAVTFDATFGGDRVRARRTQRIIEVGNVTVGKPGWLPEANATVAEEEG